MATSEDLVIGDIIVWEANENFCRRDLTVLANETMVMGQVGAINSAGKVVDVGTAQDDVYTLTAAAGTDGGTYGIRYRGDEVQVNWDQSNGTLQTAIRGLHADLDACVVAGTAGTAQTVTVTHEKKSNMFHLSIGFDFTEDGGTLGGGYTCDRTTYAEQISVICLDPIESASDGVRSFLVRDAIVDAANLTDGSADIYNRLAEPKVSDEYELSAGYGRILVRTGPTYTTLPVT